MKRLVLLFSLLGAIPGFAMEWQWLNEMRTAIQQLNYQGEFLHRRGDQTSVYAIAHSVRNGEPVELLRQLDGDMIEVLRQGNRLDCFYPEGSEDLLGSPVPAAPFSQVGAMDLDRIAQSYHAEAIGEARVAGNEARVITLSADSWRYSRKLWVDKDSGLLLQSEIRNSEGTVLEQFRYTRLTVGEPIPDEALVPTLKGNQVRRQTLYRPKPEAPDASAFRTELVWRPAMFKLIMAESKGGERQWMEKRVYSDGLATFSVFVEPASKSNLASTEARIGATSAVVAERQGLVVTVIGEVPASTLHRLLDSVSRVQ